MSDDARGLAVTLAVGLGIIALICGMAMHITGKDNACTKAGGHLEASLSSRDGAVCVGPDRKVIEP